MKKTSILTLLALTMAGTALAQTPATTPPTTMAPAPADQTAPVQTAPAMAPNQTDSSTTAAPLPGQNSFTEDQARSRLVKHGYKSISKLTMDDASIWRGTAKKHGKMVDVSVDYQGNITSK